MGMGAMHVKSPELRDQWSINASAVVLLTLLGAAGEALGYDRMLKTNKVRRKGPFGVLPGLHALLVDPDDGGRQAASADAALLS